MTIKPEHLRAAPNDSGLDLEAARLEHGVTIRYGNITLQVEPQMVAEASATLARSPIKERQIVMLSIERTLARNTAKFAAGTCTPQDCDNLTLDLVLWHCLRQAMH
jgi:hypothetical protein